MGAAERQYPTSIPGFEGISRFWDIKHNRCAAKILPGEYYVTREGEMITTVLGSCISACIRDTQTGIGGMNHFMLPGCNTKHSGSWADADALETRFGVAAMENLINEILKQGCRKQNLEVKLFGGGDVMKMKNNSVGDKNIEFAQNFVKEEGLSIAAQDLGGESPRKVIYFPETGKVLVKRLRAVQTAAIAAEETRYASKFEEKSSCGSIELFD